MHNLNHQRRDPKRNAHATKSGPGRRHDNDPTPRRNKVSAPREFSGAKLLRKVLAKVLAVPHPALAQSPGPRVDRGVTNPQRNRERLARRGLSHRAQVRVRKAAQRVARERMRAQATEAA